MKEIKKLLATCAIAFTLCALVLLWAEPKVEFKLLGSVFIVVGALISESYGEIK